jgi:hypothetical protein
MRASAKYGHGDAVCFILEDTVHKGTVEIVDAYGTYFDNSEPYYDIRIHTKEDNTMLVKHVPQSAII